MLLGNIFLWIRRNTVKNEYTTTEKALVVFGLKIYLYRKHNVQPNNIINYPHWNLEQRKFKKKKNHTIKFKRRKVM